VVEIELECSRRPPQHEPVPVAVQRDLVSGGGDLGRDLRPTLHLLADEEERRRRPGRGEQFEGGRRPLRVRAVVERQRDAGVVPDPPWDPERVRHGRDHRSRRGRRPRRREAETAVDPEAHRAIVPQSAPRWESGCATKGT